MDDDIQFIDSEQSYGKNENSYEQLLLKQIQRCIDVLSKEVIGGTIKQTKQGLQYEPDVRDLIINSVDTLEGMMIPFAEKFTEGLEELHKKINKYYEQMGKLKINVPGKGEVMVKDMGPLPADNLILIRFKEFKADVYREIFKVLLECYNKQKNKIASMSIE